MRSYNNTASLHTHSQMVCFAVSKKMILPCLTYCTARAIWGTRCGQCVVAPCSFTQPHRKPLKHRRLSTGFFPVMAL